MVDGAAVAAGVGAVTTLVPEVEPLILLVMFIIKRHQAANNGQWPSPEQVQVTYSAIGKSIDDLWAGWTPSGR